MMVLLIDIASRLEATEHYMQTCERMDTAEQSVAATSNTQTMAALPKPLATASRWSRPTVHSPATEVPHLSEEELAEGVREAVTRRLCPKQSSLS